MSGVWQAVAAIAAAGIGLALVSVLVSKNSNTTSVIQSASSGFGNIINAAVGPVSGGQSGGYLGSTGSQLSNSPGMWLT
jgi:predicted permease